MPGTLDLNRDRPLDYRPNRVRRLDPARNSRYLRRPRQIVCAALRAWALPQSPRAADRRTYAAPRGASLNGAGAGFFSECCARNSLLGLRAPAPHPKAVLLASLTASPPPPAAERCALLRGLCLGRRVIARLRRAFGGCSPPIARHVAPRSALAPAARRVSAYAPRSGRRCRSAASLRALRPACSVPRAARRRVVPASLPTAALAAHALGRKRPRARAYLYSVVGRFNN